MVIFPEDRVNERCVLQRKVNVVKSINVFDYFRYFFGTRWQLCCMEFYRCVGTAANQCRYIWTPRPIEPQGNHYIPIGAGHFSLPRQIKYKSLT